MIDTSILKSLIYKPTYIELKSFSDLVGCTIVDVIGEKGDDEIIFTLDTGERYKLYHAQDCCERVYVEDVIGDWWWILNSPVLKAEKSSNDGESKSEYDDSWTWTFYHISTFNGTVTVRWYGSSNGYYSESVDFGKCN